MSWLLPPKLVFDLGRQGRQNITQFSSWSWPHKHVGMWICCIKAQVDTISQKWMNYCLYTEEDLFPACDTFIEFLPDFWLGLVHYFAIRTPNCALSLLPQDVAEYGIIAHYSFIRLTHTALEDLQKHYYQDFPAF